MALTQIIGILDTEKARLTAAISSETNKYQKYLLKLAQSELTNLYRYNVESEAAYIQRLNVAVQSHSGAAWGSNFWSDLLAELSTNQGVAVPLPSGGGGGSSVTVVDALTSTSATSALSANQGKVLNDGKLNKVDSPVIKDWAAATVVIANQVARATTTVGSVKTGDLIRSLSGRTTGATFDTTEAGNWAVMSATVPPTIPDWSAVTDVVVGQVVRATAIALTFNIGDLIRSTANRTTGAVFNDAEAASWELLLYVIPPSLESSDATKYFMATNDGLVSVGSFTPYGTGVDNLGSDTKKFKDLYLSGKVVTTKITPVADGATGLQIANAAGTALLNIDTTTGDVLPVTDAVSSLGSATKRFKDVYISPNSLHIGDKVISNNGGVLEWGGTPVGGTVSKISSPDTLKSVEVKDTGVATVGTIAPTVTDVDDLGTTTLRYNNLYMKGKVFATDFVANDGTRDRLTAGGTSSSIVSPDGAKIVAVNNTSISTKGSIIPTVTNADDHGSAALRFKNCYLTGKHFNTAFAVNDDTRDRLTSTSTECSVISPDGAKSIVVNNTQITTTGVVKPAVNATDDLGTTGAKYKDAYLSGSIKTGASFGINDGTRDRISYNATASTLTSPDGTKTFAINNTGLSFGSALLPSANNTYDLGSGSFKWRDLYLGNAMYVSPTLIMHDGTRSRLTLSANETQLTSGNGAVNLWVNGSYVAIGGSIMPNADFGGSCGGPSNRWTYVYAQNPSINTSDAREKDELPFTYGLSEIMALRPVGFNWKTDESKEKHLGLMAQETVRIIPEVVTGGGDESYGMKYTELIPVLIKAIQELKAELDELKNR